MPAASTTDQALQRGGALGEARTRPAVWRRPGAAGSRIRRMLDSSFRALRLRDGANRLVEFLMTLQDVARCSLEGGPQLGGAAYRLRRQQAAAAHHHIARRAGLHINHVRRQHPGDQNPTELPLSRCS